MTMTLLRSRFIRIARVMHVGACEHLSENNYQRSMDEVKVTFIIDESRRGLVTISFRDVENCTSRRTRARIINDYYLCLFLFSIIRRLFCLVLVIEMVRCTVFNYAVKIAIGTWNRTHYSRHRRGMYRIAM